MSKDVVGWLLYVVMWPSLDGFSASSMKWESDSDICSQYTCHGEPSPYFCGQLFLVNNRWSTKAAFGECYGGGPHLLSFDRLSAQSQRESFFVGRRGASAYSFRERCGRAVNWGAQVMLWVLAMTKPVMRAMGPPAWWSFVVIKVGPGMCHILMLHTQEPLTIRPLGLEHPCDPNPPSRNVTSPNYRKTNYWWFIMNYYGPTTTSTEIYH